MPTRYLIDTHVHVWDLEGGPFGVAYPWLTPGPLHRTHTLPEIKPVMDAMGIGQVVLIQASDSLAETDALLRAADEAPLPVSVVGWLPLTDPGRCEEELERRDGLRLVGVRHLIHDEPNPTWLLQPSVAEGMVLLERRGLTFDAVAERPDLLAQVPAVARRHPELTVVLDHLGKPPIMSGWSSEEAQFWARQIEEVAAEPRVVAKISGLATVSRSGWKPADWQPFVDHAVDCFGSGRLMLGSDWPVSTLNGDYRSVMGGLLQVIADLPAAEQERICFTNARNIYSLPSD